MADWLSTTWIVLAQENQPPPGGGLLSMLPLIVGVGALFYFLIVLPQRRDETRRKQMLSEIKKNDRVLTHSGIYGVVTNIRSEADEVTLKVDEANNTKLKVTLNSIARVLDNEPAESK